MEITSEHISWISNAGISLIMGLYMLSLRRSSTKNTNSATRFWAAGSLITALALILKLSFLSYSNIQFVPPLLLTVGLYLYLVGIWKIKKKKIKTTFVISIILFDLLQSIVNVFYIQSHKIHMGIHLALLILYCVICIYEMFTLNSDQKYLKQIFRWNAVAYVVFFFVLLFALRNTLLIDSSIFNYPGINNHIIHSILSGLIMIALTFGFLSAVNMILDHELKAQINTKTKIFSIIAHDLRGPIGNIMSFLEFLKDENNLSESEKKEYINILENLSHSTYHLLQNLLEWTKQSQELVSTELEKISLKALIIDQLDFFRTMAATKSIQMDFADTEDIYIRGNTRMIQTVIRNIISNALKFTPKNGKVQLLIERRAKTVCLIISDTGQGISKKFLSTLKNNEGHTTKGTEGEVGSGLGMILCRDFIHLNSGHMDIQSKEGIGTTVTLEFPRLNTIKKATQK